MQEKILVPLDGSKLAEVALPYAEEIASRLKKEVVLLQVVPRAYYADIDYGIYAQVPFTEEKMESLKASAQDYLKKVASRLEGKGVTIRSEVKFGNAADEIITLANKIDNVVITMSTHGRSGISRWALGSVADKVTRGTERPVVLIRAKGARPDMRKKDLLDKALVPLDGSRASEAVIPYIEELAQELKAEVTIFQVVPLSYHDICAGVGSEYIYYRTSQMLWNKKNAEGYLDKVVAQLKQKGVNAKSEVRFGDAAEEIIETAAEIKADVVAMSTHGRSGVGRWVLGSVAEKILHEGNTPLLLVRSLGASVEYSDQHKESSKTHLVAQRF